MRAMKTKKLVGVSLEAMVKALVLAVERLIEDRERLESRVSRLEAMQDSENVKRTAPRLRAETTGGPRKRESRRR